MESRRSEPGFVLAWTKVADRGVGETSKRWATNQKAHLLVSHVMQAKDVHNIPRGGSSLPHQ